MERQLQAITDEKEKRRDYKVIQEDSTIALKESLKAKTKCISDMEIQISALKLAYGNLSIYKIIYIIVVYVCI
jgi:hypothetical protein